MVEKEFPAKKTELINMRGRLESVLDEICAASCKKGEDMLKLKLAAKTDEAIERSVESAAMLCKRIEEALILEEKRKSNWDRLYPSFLAFIIGVIAVSAFFAITNEEIVPG